MKKCISCGAELEDDSKFCFYCGKQQPTDSAHHCPQCGAKIIDGNMYCIKCGSKIAEDYSTTPVACASPAVDTTPQSDDDANEATANTTDKDTAIPATNGTTTVTDEKPNKKSNSGARTAIIITLIVISIVGIIVGVSLVLQEKSNREAAEKTRIEMQNEINRLKAEAKAQEEAKAAEERRAQEEAERQAKAELEEENQSLAFLSSMYSHVSYYERDWLIHNCTNRALNILSDAYYYEGDGYASWEIGASIDDDWAKLDNISHTHGNRYVAKFKYYSQEDGSYLSSGSVDFDIIMVDGQPKIDYVKWNQPDRSNWYW